MRKRYNPYALPPWLRQIRNLCAQFIVPITVFQAIRIIIIPTTLDVILLAIFIFLALSFYFEWL
jgi:hypothetical protein